MASKALSAPDQRSLFDQAVILDAHAAQTAQPSEASMHFFKFLDTKSQPQPTPIIQNASTTHPLPIFEMPSIKPQSFPKPRRNCSIYELQIYIDNYLDSSFERCELYGFAPSVAEISKQNQLTYVQFTSTGLIGKAREKWLQIPKQERFYMNWTDYEVWIRNLFGYPLIPFDQAVCALDDLRQTESARIYSQEFNTVLDATTSVGVDHGAKFLCARYRLGLKTHLRTLPDLLRITEDLDELQKHAEYLDDVMSKTSNFAESRYPPASLQLQKRKSSVDLGNTQQTSPSPRLTPDQKALYRSKGWCVYCQAKEHDTDHCVKLRNRRAQA